MIIFQSAVHMYAYVGEAHGCGGGIHFAQYGLQYQVFTLYMLSACLFLKLYRVTKIDNM